MTAVTTVQDRARPASGIAIVPEQLERMRDRRALSRQKLAERAGEILFDRDWFAEVLSGRVQPDAQLARTLWMALDAEPADLIRGLPARLPRAEVPLWLRRNPGEWTLDLKAVRRLRQVRARLDEGTGELRTWTPADLADAAARHWYSRDMVNKIETGERRPSSDALDAFCQVLDCEPADLMDDAPELPPGNTQAHRELLGYNWEMREYADARGIRYRNGAGRIKYPDALREAFARYLAGRLSRGLEVPPGTGPDGWPLAHPAPAADGPSAS